jgi:WD40 repeat protein
MRRLSILGLILMIGMGGVFAQDAPPSTIEFVARFGRGWAQTAAWSPDGTRLAVAGSIGVWVYDASDWDAEPVLFETDYWTTWAEFSPGGGLLAVGLADGTAQAFDVATGEFLERIIGGPVPERGAMANFNVAARRANFVPATTVPGRTPQGAVGEVVLNDVDGTELRLQVLIFGDDLPEPQLVSPDGEQTVSLTRDAVTVADASGQLVTELAGYSLPIVDLGFSAVGDSVIAERIDGTGQVYDAVTGADLGIYPLPRSNTGGVIAAVDPISQRTAFAIRGNLQIFDPSVGLLPAATTNDRITSLAFEPGGARLAVGYAAGNLQIIDVLEESQNLRSAYAHFGHVPDIVWLPESSYLVTAGEEGRIKLWQVDAAELGGAEIFGGHADEVTSLAVSPDDPMLFASASLDGTIKLWRIKQ